jgi:hypothetical protein
MNGLIDTFEVFPLATVTIVSADGQMSFRIFQVRKAPCNYDPAETACAEALQDWEPNRSSWMFCPRKDTISLHSGCLAFVLVGQHIPANSYFLGVSAFFGRFKLTLPQIQG